MAIRIKSKWSKTVKRAKTTDDVASALSNIGWKISLDKAKMTGTFISIPERDDINLTVNEQLVVELYSK